jgi:penicillin amidase
MNIPRLVFRLLLGRRLSTTHVSMRVPGVHRPVTIRRDGYGIPHIEADEEWDAWYGLGFCQGQDRAFKLESLMRVARGTLAERVGPSALPLDRLSRRIGFSHSAERQVELLSPDIRQMLEAFARGVNDGIKLDSRRKAHEFAILRASPTPFTAVDSIAISKLICFGMASNWDVELARLKIARDDGKDALLSLEPTYPEWPPV